MYSRYGPTVAICLVFATILIDTGSAAEIRMKNGTVYAGVTIIRQGALTVECYAKQGKIALSTGDIDEIDGVEMSRIPPDTLPFGSLPQAPAKPRATPRLTPIPSRAKASEAASPSAGEKNTATLPNSRVPAIPDPPAIKPESPAILTPRSPALAPPTPVSPTPAPPRFSTPMMVLSPWALSWQFVAIAIFCVVWLISVFRVWRKSGRTSGGRRFIWTVAALVLPILGYMLYAAKSLMERRRGNPEGANASLHEFVFLDENHRPVMIEPGEVDSGLENAKGVLQAALYDRASDVHIEPGPMEYRVRFRIDGVLHPRINFTPEQGLRMLSALKSVAQIDISERRRAQDGRFGGRAAGREADFRAATTPTVHGEKLVLRILDQKSGVRGLADLGMTQSMMERFAEVIQFRSGMILATGPTGSGKTSSLYAALTQLDAVRLNIVTIEDPVEYELAGATQIPVNVKAGITYESGLRSILRQDPDVILVGEMRDQEAAQIALRSALTGHLVFSSLHSRDAVGTIHRLEEMGIERHLLASALLVVLSQRLVRVLCPDCRKASVCTGDELADIGIALPVGETIYQAGGCRACEGTGYLGRTGVFEMLVLNEALRQEINEGTPEDTFAKSARAGGYREYREDGAEKILLGITSVEEVLQAN